MLYNRTLTGNSAGAEGGACPRRGGRVLQFFGQPPHAPGRLRESIRQHGIEVLNIAGPRGIQEPDVVGFLKAALTLTLAG
jgi:hypothetical protein